MAKLIASVTGSTLEALRPLGEQALAAGADLIELRLDGHGSPGPSFREWVAGLPAGRWIVTCRSTAEGGASDAPAEARARLLADLAGEGRGIVDFEYAAWRASAAARECLERVRSAGLSGKPRLILSSHHFEGRPVDAAGLLREIAAVGGVVPKVAWMSQSICDSLEALELARRAPVPGIVICMGEAGLPSRVLAGKVGAYGTYCAAASGGETAPGQASLAQMREVFQWGSIRASTRVFGVIGWPVGHSMSPLLHNSAFARAGVDAVYLPLAVDPVGEVLESFLDRCLHADWLNVGGFSVTVPHKGRVPAYLGGAADKLAQQIGAVNTLIVQDGKYRGYNTDYSGALGALIEELGPDRACLRDTAVDVLGAGGAARAVVAGLRSCGARVTLSNIVHDDTVHLADEFACEVRPWAERGQGRGAVLINCTSVGMWPEVDATPMPPESLPRYAAVFDVVYNPLETRLLRDAAAAGCRTIRGVEMFVHQAAEQFRLWTGREADVGLMRQLVIGELTRHG
ncbi:MAG: type I 3-dehydroquinate dehydratase [Phycisphaerae bacterium]|nr:type I 3-dehydroquinate dehydratase [Phycisphaerae bacterium]